jgi:CelD/BcsL family acetyltransferase involved in cellulose biosynthesis
MITVTVCSPLQFELGGESGRQWDDLVARASPNAFMHPAALQAAASTGHADIAVLLARDLSAGQLVGVWALGRKKPLALWPQTLQALPFYYAALSSPVIDPAHADAVMPAFLAAIARDAALPKVIHLHSFSAEDPACNALLAVLGRNHPAALLLGREARPVVSREFGVKRTGATRKKLRQDWNRLAALGRIKVRNDRAPDAVTDAFETFLTLELASWKGDNGTALLSSERDAAFGRRLIRNLAEAGAASVALLCVDGRAIAAQVLMYCGRTAYTWKISFDPAYGKFSPGALLVDKITEQLFAGCDIDAIDSCAVEKSFMATLWSGRRDVVELLIDAGQGRSWAFALEAARLRAYHYLRGLRDQWQARRASPKPRKATQASNAAESTAPDSPPQAESEARDAAANGWAA